MACTFTQLIMIVKYKPYFLTCIRYLPQYMIKYCPITSNIWYSNSQEKGAFFIWSLDNMTITPDPTSYYRGCRKDSFYIEKEYICFNSMNIHNWYTLLLSKHIQNQMRFTSYPKNLLLIEDKKIIYKKELGTTFLYHTIPRC